MGGVHCGYHPCKGGTAGPLHCGACRTGGQPGGQAIHSLACLPLVASVEPGGTGGVRVALHQQAPGSPGDGPRRPPHLLQPGRRAPVPPAPLCTGASERGEHIVGRGLSPSLRSALNHASTCLGMAVARLSWHRFGALLHPTNSCAVWVEASHPAQSACGAQHHPAPKDLQSPNPESGGACRHAAHAGACP